MEALGKRAVEVLEKLLDGIEEPGEGRSVDLGPGWSVQVEVIADRHTSITQTVEGDGTSVVEIIVWRGDDGRYYPYCRRPEQGGNECVVHFLPTARRGTWMSRGRSGWCATAPGGSTFRSRR
jgi:hypothetical protein